MVESEDIAQETYLKLARYIARGGPLPENRVGLFALLAVLIRRLAADAARWETRARRDASREATIAGHEADDNHAARGEIELADLLDHVSQSLEPVEQQILSLRLQDYTVTEIAERIGSSQRTVERRLKHIRMILRPHFPAITDDLITT